MNEDREERHPHVVAIVEKIKSEGIFDALRRDCLADVDLKPAYQNLKQKVEHACAMFLSRIAWSSKLNKIQLREQMRKNLEESGVLQAGVKRIVHQVVSPKIDLEVKPKVAKVVCEYLGLNPDDIQTEDDDVEESQYQQTTESSVGLYPYNPLEPPAASADAPTALPGFDESDKPSPTQVGEVPEVRFEELPTKNEDKSSDKQEDMDISEKSDSRSTSRASTKKSMDMDCTMTSDEEEDAAAVNGADLSKGLAAYMASNTQTTRNDDDMSISSSDTSSKRGLMTPEPTEDSKVSAPGTSGGRKRGKADVDTPPVERREMRRQRTRNKKYMSDDFESIFTENKELLGGTYSQEFVEEEIITTDDVVTQVVVEDTAVATKSQSQQSEESSDTTACSSGKQTPLQSHPSYNLRRSHRNRGAKDLSPEQPVPAVPQENAIAQETEGSNNNKQTDSCKPSQGLRRALRSSKSLTASQSQSGRGTADNTGITPRRYTRATSKQLPVAGANEVDSVDVSAGSTPTQDEGTVISLPDSLVVLSDICASQLKGTDADNAASDLSNTGDSTLIKDEVDDASTSDTVFNASVPEEAPLTESYEPELHFDEMSRDMVETVHVGPSKADSVTASWHEPMSPDRVTESPTSPPSSPTESQDTVASTSMVTIPLEGDDSYHSVVESEPTISGPRAILLTVIDDICMPSAHQPPLPPELPPLPAVPAELMSTVPPPEPDIEEEEEEEVYYEVVDEVGADDSTSPAGNTERDSFEQSPVMADGDQDYSQSEGEEADDDDLEELERLAQKKLEILKAIELPDSVLEKPMIELSSDEEGQISDSSEDRSRAKKKKSKKSKKKKSKKESRKRKHQDYDDSATSSKRNRYY